MHHWQIEAPNLMNLSPHSGLHVPPSSLDIKSPQKFQPKAAGATELETASSCMPEIESKGRGCRNFESRAKDKPFEERRRNQKTNVWRFPNFHLHIAGNCLNERGDDLVPTEGWGDRSQNCLHDVPREAWRNSRPIHTS